MKRVLFAVLALAAVGFAFVSLREQWIAFRASGQRITPHWPPLALSAVLVLAAYAVLIETWRRVVAAWNAALSFPDAARIWFISNLGRYLPGKIWQITAMGVMAQERGVSAIAATGSSLVVNLVNVVVGLALVAVLAARFFDRPLLATVLGLAMLAASVALPWILPVIGLVASRMLGRSMDVPHLPHAAIWTAALGCLVAWLLYGTAFQLLAAGVLGAAPGPTTHYTAAFTGSYLLGYIALFTPGGLGVREASLIDALRRMGLGAGGGAGLLALASRLWLTLLELAPGLLLLALAALQRAPSPLSRRDDQKP